MKRQPAHRRAAAGGYAAIKLLFWLVEQLQVGHRAD
jgi:hypothetical protein